MPFWWGFLTIHYTVEHDESNWLGFEHKPESKKTAEIEESREKVMHSYFGFNSSVKVACMNVYPARGQLGSWRHLSWCRPLVLNIAYPKRTWWLWGSRNTGRYVVLFPCLCRGRYLCVRSPHFLILMRIY
jgi:hypothetical protein